MRIAILRKKYTFYGGAEGFTQGLITQLADAGHEIHIYSIRWSAHFHRNISFHKVPAITFNSFLKDLSFAISSYLILKKQRKYFDIIQSHDKTLYQDVYRAGDGCHVEWLRQRWKRMGLPGKTSIMFNPYHWLILSIERMIFKGKRFKKVVAISELVKKNIIDNYHLNQQDIKVVYNGVDLKRFYPENRDIYRGEIRKKYSITKDDFVALFVGSGFERKGVEFLLKAAERASRPITLLIVGRGSRKKYKRFIEKQRVIFCGPQKEIQGFYAASDVFLFPTIYEPFGNVHLEALASGLPVITTKQSGASEIIENGKQGFVVEKPEKTDEIAEKVIRLMDRNVNRRMSEEARKLAEKFTFERHINQMLDLYDAVTTASRKG